MNGYRALYGAQTATEIDRDAAIIAAYRAQALEMAKREEIIKIIMSELPGDGWALATAYNVLRALEMKGYAVAVRA